jgi:bacillopeptidase F
MDSRFSRLARFEEKRAYQRLFLSILATITIILMVIFLGIPALVKFSIFIGGIKGGPETTQDTTKPFPPILESPGEATNSATITISGYAEPESTLEVFLNARSFKKILVGGDGQFSIASIILTEGENKITGKATDQAGNTSTESQAVTITYKKTQPKLELSKPADNENFNGDNKEAEVSGLTDPGNNLTVSGRFVRVRPDGSFSYSYPLVTGENLLKIVATDIAGNQTTVERKVNYSP